MEENKKQKGTEFVSNIWNKTAEISKKAVKGVQESAKSFSEKSKQESLERKKQRLNPLTPKEFKSKSFNIPNVIRIVDDAERRDIELCKGAIGWRETVNDVEVLFIYDEWVQECGLIFVPSPKCDDVYCVDAFDRSRFIKTDCIFGKVNEEKLAELEHIAYSLGAKCCSIEILETDLEKQRSSISAVAKYNGMVASASNEAQSQNMKKQSGKNISYFEGNAEPVRPKLKWFAHDDNINGLIEMRCAADGRSIKSKILELKGAYSATMSRKTACAIDKILKVKGSLSMEKQAIKEHSSTLVFSVEF